MRTSVEIGKVVKALRKENNISLTDFAKKLGINKSTLSRYENGTRKIPMEDIAAFANALNVTPEYLLLDDQPQPKHFETIAAHLDGDLTKEEWEEVIQYANYIRNKRK